MKLGTTLTIAGIVVLAAGAAAYFGLPRHSAGPVAMEAAPLATPLGVTIQRLGETETGRSQVPTLLSRAGRKLGYADAKGMTFYTYDKDAPAGASACTGDCAKAWLPAVAPASAQGTGDWSLLPGDNGAKQWARKGKRLYISTKDTVPGHMKGEGAESGAWHVAMVQPGAEMVVPKGMIGVMEVADAGGQALVDGSDMTLYAFSGDANQDASVSCATPPCASHWIPVVAPQLANGIGDFSVIARKDGNKQWAFKGAPLYKFDNDIQSGDANGIGVDKRWNVALVMRYFLPAEASLQQNIAHGLVLAAADGKTLYHQDGYTYEPGGHGMYHSIPPRPLVGRQIGTKSCEGDCLAAWRPLAAPASAQSSGYWEVLARADGTRQWSYQGYALYTYGGDKKPGDMTGDDIYDLKVSDDSKKAVDLPMYQIGAGALFWTFMSP